MSDLIKEKNSENKNLINKNNLLQSIVNDFTKKIDESDQILKDNKK